MRAVLFFLLLATAARAADPVTVEEWIADLTTTFFAQTSFLATYESKGEGKSLVATVGMDMPSDLSVIDVVLVKGGREVSIRNWNNAAGDIFIKGGGTFGRMASFKDESIALSHLLPTPEAGGQGGQPPVDIPVGFLLTPDSIEVGFQLFAYPPTAPWEKAVEGSTVKAVDGKAVTFLTPGHGTLVISRESGMVWRQDLAGAAGEKRILQLTDYKRLPGEDIIRGITAGWETADARPIPTEPAVKSLRRLYFQGMLAFVDQKGVPLADFQTKILGSQENFLRFARYAAARDVPDSGFATTNWARVLETAREELRREWQAGQTGIAGPSFEKTFDEPRLRETLRGRIAGAYVKSAGTRSSALADVIGTQPAPGLTATTEPGKQAVKLLESAIASAYIAALAERKMDDFWGPSKAAP